MVSVKRTAVLLLFLLSQLSSASEMPERVCVHMDFHDTCMLTGECMYAKGRRMFRAGLMINIIGTAALSMLATTGGEMCAPSGSAVELQRSEQMSPSRVPKAICYIPRRCWHALYPRNRSIAFASAFMSRLRRNNGRSLPSNTGNCPSNVGLSTAYSTPSAIGPGCVATLNASTRSVGS